MGAYPTVIEANQNLGKYVGEIANMWDCGGKVFLSIGERGRVLISGELNDANDELNVISNTELTGIKISSEQVLIPARLYGHYEITRYTLTVSFLGRPDQIVTSDTGFTLEQKNSAGEMLLESRIGGV